MTLDEVLQRAAADGVSLSVQGQSLRVRAGATGLDPALREALAQHKGQLLQLLQRRQVQASAAPLVARDRSGEPVPLSFAQQQLWLFEQLQAQAGPVYHIPVCAWLDGPLDPARLERALARCVHRHEALRTACRVQDGQAVQVVMPAQLALEVLDLSAQADPEVQALAAATALVRQRLDLAAGVLMRAQLLRVAAQRSLLAMSLHHIAADAWSVAVLLRDLQQMYLDDGALPSLPLRYADAAAWQREALSGERLESLRAFWRQALAGAPALLDLPTDRPRPAQQSFRGGMERFVLPPALVRRARDGAAQHQATLFQVMLAAFQALLHRYSRQETIVVGTPVAGRDHPQLEPLVGYFVNTLALRVDIAPGLDFAGLLAQTVKATLGAYEHQALPFELLVAELAPQRSTAYNPIFQVMFALQSAPVPPHRMGEVNWRQQAVDLGTSKFDVYLSLQERDDGSLAAEWEYASDLFDAASVQRMASHYVRLLDAALQSPRAVLATLPLLAPDEARRMLREWNDNALAWPQEQSLVHLFAQQAQATPEAVAVADAQVDVTYRELQARALCVARHLRARGVVAEDRVGLQLSRRVDVVAAMLGAMWAGAAYVALDPAYPPARLQFMAEDAKLACLLDDEALDQVLADAAAQDQEATPALMPLPGPAQLAYLIYTSGSTGRPKGILIEHRNAVSLIAWARTVFTPQDLAVTLAATSFCFDLSIFEVFLPLACGGTVVLAENALSLQGHPWRERITLVNTVPSAMAELVRSGTLPRSVQVVNLAGEPLKAALVDQIYACGHVRDVYDLYGPGETTTYSTWVRRTSGGRESIGRPIANTRLYILDEALQPVPVGVPGEIYLGGAGVTRGYLERPQLTAERYVADPFQPGERMYRSGDLGRFWPDGQVQYLGRIDHQIKLRGFRIELGEVEQALAGCPDIGDSAVHAPVDPLTGQRTLVAYWSGKADGLGLRLALARQLPGYMVPTAWVRLAVLPRTPNGKLDRQALPLPEAVPADGRGGTGAPPQGPVEALLAQVWERVLRRQGIGREDNFFQCGGDSILAMQVAAQARAAGLALEPAHLFQAQTVAELALLARADDAGAAATGFAEAAQLGAEVPLAPVQRWCLAHASEVPAHHAQWLLVAVPGDLSPQVLARALDAVVATHPALRLRFECGPQGWRQCAGPAEGSVLMEQGGIDANDPERAAASLSAGMDLARGPLLRARLSPPASVSGSAPTSTPDPTPSRWLLLAAHHLVIDGVSWRIVLDDLIAACVRMETAQVPDLPAERAAWSAWARQQSGLPDLMLADGRFGRAGQARRARGHLEAGETARLVQAAAAGRHAAVHELLAEALRAALGSWDAPRAASLDIEHHGRDGDMDLSRTVGWFTRLDGSAQVAFNHLGDLDRALPDAAGWRLASMGLSSAPDRPRSHGLAVASWLAGGCLHWEIEHDPARDDEAAIARLQTLWSAQMQRLQQDGELPFAAQEPFASNLVAVVPASDTQQGMLMHTLLAPQGEVYTTRLSVTLQGQADPVAFEAAWREVRHRHPVLRSCFARDAGGQLLQVVLRDPGDSALGLWGRPGDLPGVDCRLVPLDEGLARLDWRSHHALLDGWSLSLLLQDIAAAYQVRREGSKGHEDPAGRTDRLPRADVSGAGARSAVPVAKQAGPADAAFWREELAGCLEPPELPFLRPGPGSTQRQTVRLALEPALVEAVRPWCRAQRVTLHTLLQGLWALLLSRLADSPEVIFGGAVSGRSAAPELQSQVGLLMRTVPVVVQVPEDAAVGDWLRQLQQRHAMRERHAQLPLLEMAALAGRPRGEALFENLFVLENYPVPPGLLVGFGGLAVRGLEIDERPHYPLSLIAQEGPGLELALVFDPARIDAAWATSLPHRLASLVSQVLGGTASVGGLDIVLPDERRQMLQAWNDTDRNWGPGLREATLMDLFEQQVARSPEALALVGEEGALSYAQLDARANHLAKLLQARGVGPDTLVGVSMVRSLELVIALYGILKAGGAYVPLDPDWPAPRLEFMRSDVQLQMVVDRALVAQATGLPVPPARATGPQHLAYMIYTSGSTGRPKGALNTQAGIVNRLLWMQDTFPLHSGDRVLQKTPMSFDVSVWEFFWPLMTGATLVLARPGGHLDSAYLAELIQRERITTLHFVPSMLQVFLESPASVRCRGLRRVFVSGEALSPQLAQACVERLPAELHNLYGPTEAAVDVTWWPCPRDRRIEQVPIGRPVANTQIHVVDRGGRLCVPGLPGEICIGGVQVGLGYWRRDELTRERFVADPFSRDGGCLYRTGDRGQWLPDGQLAYLGRRDFQLKLRGVRIELGEIEAALRDLPGVREAVVIARDQAQDRVLHAYVTGVPAELAQGQALRQLLRERLPEVMVPAAVVCLAEMPLSTNGKLDRSALPVPDAGAPDLVAARGAATATGLSDARRAGRHGEVARLITEAWVAVLGHDAFSGRDNFFDVGGHSLRLMRVHARLMAHFGESLSLMDLFAHPSVDALARHLCQQDAPAAGVLVPTAAAPGDGSTRGLGVAVIGMACRVPGAADVESFWNLLLEGREGISRLEDADLLAAGESAERVRDGRYVKAYGVLADADAFDAALFDVPPAEAEILDPQQRVFLECAWAALEHAGHDPRGGPRDCGVYAGAGLNSYALHHLQPHAELMAQRGAFAMLLASDKDFLASRVAYKLDLRGPAMAVQTACSTSLVAITMAAQAIARGDCEMALAGGVSVRFPQVRGHLHEEGMILSADGHTRSFDAEASGVVFGSGAGVVVLKRLDRALADGDTVHAVIEGAALNNDGAAKAGYTAPGIDGQAQVIDRALACAGVSARTIGMVEAHGTGTPLGDPIEVTSLRRAWERHTTDTGFCALGSVKANVGHLDAAAGVTGFIKAVLAVSRGVVPPQINFRQPHPALELASSPFYVPAQPQAWPGEGPRRAAVSAFGIGGTNAHVIVRQAPELLPEGTVGGPTTRGEDAREVATSGKPLQLVAVSACSPQALQAASDRLAQALDALPFGDFPAAAYTLLAGRWPMPYRRAVAAASPAEAAEVLRTPASANAQPARPRELVFLFPGFGSQYAGMARALHDSEPVFRAVFDRGAVAVAAHAGIDLHQVLASDSQSLLRDPVVAQPAIVLISCAIAQWWQSWGLQPVAVLGNSVGELSAACFAGALSLDDALRFCVDRVRHMAAAAPGAMLAVPLSARAVASWLGSSMAVAVHSAPDSVVITGPAADIAALQATLDGAGIESRRLEGELATHSPGMAAAASGVAQAFNRASRRAPRLPLVSNLSGAWFDAATVQDPAYWARHVHTPVRLDLCLRAVAETYPEACFLEVGPGRSLCTAVRANLGAGALALPSLAPPGDALPEPHFLRRTAASLWAAGVTIDPLAASGLRAPRRVPLPAYPFERRRFLISPGPAQAAQSSTPLPPSDWLQWPTWERAMPLAHTDVVRDRVVLVADYHGLAERLARLLGDVGVAVMVTNGGEDYPRAVDFLRGARLPALIHLISLNAGDDPAGQIDLALRDPLDLARALAGAGLQTVRVRLVSAGVQAVTGEEKLQPFAAALAGPAATLGLEFEGLDCRWIDLPAPEPMWCEALLAELEDDSEPLIAYRAGARWQRRFAPMPWHGKTVPLGLRAGGCYVVTGGLGAVGLELACAIAQAAPGARLVLVNRRVDSQRRAEAQARLEAAGAQCQVIQADVSDWGALESALAAVCGDGLRIDGLVHAAGVAGGGTMARRESRGGLIEFDAKVDGARHLLSWASRHVPDFVLLCSSTSVHTGGFGSAAYTAANAILDAMALQARAAGVPALAVDWYRWQGLGMARETERLHRRHTGQALQDGLSAEGVRQLLPRLLSQQHLGVLAVCPWNLGMLVHQARRTDSAHWHGKPPIPGEGAEATAPERAPIEQADLHSDTERALAAIWRDVLGVPRIGRADSFTGLGGDSLLALRVLGRIRAGLSVALPLRELFEQPTLADLAKCVDALRGDASAKALAMIASDEETGVI